MEHEGDDEPSEQSRRTWNLTNKLANMHGQIAHDTYMRTLLTLT